MIFNIKRNNFFTFHSHCNIFQHWGEEKNTTIVRASGMIWKGKLSKFYINMFEAGKKCHGAKWLLTQRLTIKIVYSPLLICAIWQEILKMYLNDSSPYKTLKRLTAKATEINENTLNSYKLFANFLRESFCRWVHAV